MPKNKSTKASSGKTQSKNLMYVVFANRHLIKRVGAKKTEDLGLIVGCSFLQGDAAYDESQLLGQDHMSFDLQQEGSSLCVNEKAPVDLIKSDQTWYDQNEALHTEFYAAMSSMPKSQRNARIEGREEICARQNMREMRTSLVLIHD